MKIFIWKGGIMYVNGQEKEVKADWGKRDPKAKSLCSKIDDHKSSHGKIRIETGRRLHRQKKGIFRQELFTPPGLC